MNEPTLLDLFSGIGGFSLAFECEGFRTVGFSEIDPEASIVLAHHWPGIRNYGDIRTITRRILNEIGPVDVITGGVPCQPASALGQMRGTADERWLWPEAIRVVSELRPRVAVFENPPSLLRLEDGRAWDGIVNGLAALGYDCLWEIIPAAIVGAGHIRERLILIAIRADNDGFHADFSGFPSGEISQQQKAGILENNAPDGDGCGWEARAGLCESESGRERWGRHCNVHGEEGDAPDPAGEQMGSAGLARQNGYVAHADSDSLGLQRHAGNEASNGRRQGRARGAVAPPDLRGRVSCENWWHENVTGIPVLVHGLSSRLDEASCRCTGNAVVPQVARIIARAVKEYLK